MAETGPTNEGGGLHEGAGGIAEENPVDGEADAELAVIEVFVVPGDVASLGEDAEASDGIETFGGDFLNIIAAMLDTEIDEVVFQAGGFEEFVVADEKLALFAVFFAAIDFR